MKNKYKFFKKNLLVKTNNSDIIVVNKDLIIDSKASGVDIALLEDKLLVELHKEKTNTQHSVGDIYVGKVKKIMSGLNAAFVDVGFEKDAFLHYLDLGQQYNSVAKFVANANNDKPESLSLDNFELEPEIEKVGKISSVLKANQKILVQIAKEPISSKGPKVSSEISFAGRFLVLLPFSNKISISQKIKSADERNRLKRLIQSIRPHNFGVIIRTVAEGKSVAELDSDLRSLIEKWEQLVAKLPKAIPPQKIVSELDKTSALLRDILNNDFSNIYVNSQEIYEEAKHYLQAIAPNKVDIVKLYKQPEPIFDHFGVTKQIKNSFGKVVTIRSGIYLVIEHTEALHVIDVNSGHLAKSDQDQEGNASMVNLGAAVEIARQLRLRDMGGIIVIDFIDMHLAENRKALYQKLVEEMEKDKARHTILPPSKFGLVQITRQRVRPQINLDISEKCPTCKGTGTIKSSIILVDELESNLRYLIHEQNEKKLHLVVHPYIDAYIRKGIFSLQWKWFRKYKQWIKVSADTSFNMLDYQFLDKNNEIIKM